MPVVHGKGILFAADPHVADEPPFDRQGAYCQHVLDKLRFCLETAHREHLIPVFLGDMFHWPVANSPRLLEALVRLFRPYCPWVMTGNHDTHYGTQAITPDLSIQQLSTRHAIHLIHHPGPVFRLKTGDRQTILGSSPHGYPLPTSFMSQEEVTVIWISHHHVAFGDFRDNPIAIQEIPGVHLVVNGHIHRPQPSETRGMTRWVNPGSMTRLTQTPHTLKRQPKAAIWRLGDTEPQPLRIPHLPVETVFPGIPRKDDSNLPSPSFRPS